MNLKINLFTVLIFAYSIIICAIFKKDDNVNFSNNKTIHTTKQSTENSANKVTASNATDLKNPNQ